MSKKTVVAVSYGDSSFGQPISCEVFTADPAEISTQQLREMIAGHAPQPGELDDPRAVRRRYDRLRELGGTVEMVASHEIDMAERVSGDTGREAFDADYTNQIGQLLVFDAEVDDATGRVDWYTATPNPITNPLRVQMPEGGRLYRRLDGVILSTAHLESGQHDLKVTDEGVYIPVNEFNQPVVDLTEETWAQYQAADLSDLRNDTLVACARQDASGNLRMTTQPLRDVAASGRLLDPLEHGFFTRSMDFEVMRESAGDNQKFVNDPRGNPMWVAVVDFPCTEANRYGNVPGDALAARPSSEYVAMIEPSFARDGTPLISFTEPQAEYGLGPRDSFPSWREIATGRPERPPVMPDPGPQQPGNEFPSWESIAEGKPETSFEPAGLGGSGEVQQFPSWREIAEGRPEAPYEPSATQQENRFPSWSEIAGSGVPVSQPPPQAQGGDLSWQEIAGRGRPTTPEQARDTHPFRQDGQPRNKDFPSVEDLLQGPEGSAGTPGAGVRPRLASLAGMNASVRSAAAVYGARLVESAKATANDPQVRQDLKRAAVVGLEAAVMAKGGSKARGAAALGALGQLKDLPTVQRLGQSKAGKLGLEHLRNSGGIGRVGQHNPSADPTRDRGDSGFGL